MGRSEKGNTNVVQNVVVQQSQTQTGTSWLRYLPWAATFGIIGYLCWPQDNPPVVKNCPMPDRPTCESHGAGLVGIPKVKSKTTGPDGCDTYTWNFSDCKKPKPQCTTVIPEEPSCASGYSGFAMPNNGTDANNYPTYGWHEPVCKKICDAKPLPTDAPSCPAGFEGEFTLNDKGKDAEDC